MIVVNRKKMMMNEKPAPTALYDPSKPRFFHLGTHTLEVLEDQAILLMDTTTGKEVVQLDEEAAYLLAVALLSLYQQHGK